MNALLTREDLLAMARAAGFADVGVTGVDLTEDERHLDNLAGRRRGTARWAIWPGTARAAVARRNCCPAPCV